MTSAEVIGYGGLYRTRGPAVRTTLRDARTTGEWLALPSTTRHTRRDTSDTKFPTHDIPAKPDGRKVACTTKGTQAQPFNTQDGAPSDDFHAEGPTRERLHMHTSSGAPSGARPMLDVQRLGPWRPVTGHPTNIPRRAGARVAVPHTDFMPGRAVEKIHCRPSLSKARAARASAAAGGPGARRGDPDLGRELAGDEDRPRSHHAPVVGGDALRDGSTLSLGLPGRAG